MPTTIVWCMKHWQNFLMVSVPNILNYKKLFLNYTSDSRPPPPHLKDLQQVSISFRIKFNSLLYLTKSYMIWILPLSAASFFLLIHCIPTSLSFQFLQHAKFPLLDLWIICYLFLGFSSSMTACHEKLLLINQLSAQMSLPSRGFFLISQLDTVTKAHTIILSLV